MKNLFKIFAIISVPPVDALALNTIAIPTADINVPNIVANIKSLVILIGIKFALTTLMLIIKNLNI